MVGPAPRPPHYVLAAWERISGRVRKLPNAGEYKGNRLWSQRPDVSVVSLPATSRKGHTVLERELVGQRVRVGSRVTITYLGVREACRETRRHRAYRLEVVA